MRILFLVVLILAGCANPNFDVGMNNLKSGRYAASIDSFVKCFEESKEPACANNAGAIYEGIGNTEYAKRWYTLAARYGYSKAISNLTRNGWPVPVADLAQQQAAQPDIWDAIGKGLNAAAGGLSEDVYRAQRGLPPAAPQPTPHTPPQIYESTCGYKSDGNYHCGRNCGYKSDGNYHCE